MCCVAVCKFCAKDCHAHVQVSQRESKDGNEGKVEASKTFTRVIAAGLHRIATAMAKDSDCISKASKVSNQLCLFRLVASAMHCIEVVAGVIVF